MPATNLEDKFAALQADNHTIEGTSVGDGDNKLAYLRVLAAIPFDTLLEDIVLGLETVVAAARLYLEQNIGSALPDWAGVPGCATNLGSAIPVLAADGRTYPTWLTIPTNTTLGSITTPPDIYGLSSTLPTHWQGVTIYVQSNKPTYTLSAVVPLVLPTGHMYTITTDIDFILAPSIQGEGSITVYICTELLDPAAIEYTFTSENQGGYNCPIWTSPPATSVSGDGGSGMPAGPFAFNCYAYAIPSGAQVKKTVGDGVHFYYKSGSTWAFFDLTDVYQDIPANAAVWCYSTSPCTIKVLA
jgi:hypothetical protein